MNVHPLLVHFPVALLSIYAILELLRFRRLMEKPYWFFLKASLAIAGATSAIAAFGSGDEHYERTHPASRALVEVHSTFAGATVAVFCVLGAAYLIQWINREYPKAAKSRQWLWKLLTNLSTFVLRAPIAMSLALLGLFFITMTGGLGGAIAYGPNVDPAVTIIYNIAKALFL